MDRFRSGPSIGEDRPRSILDPVHGLIRFTDREFAVICHPLFQRLRRIKQNGLLFLVFPSATHTRFEHSLGALYVADTMLRALISNSIVARHKGAVASFGRASEDRAVDLSEVPADLMAWVWSTARLAALAHDMGHGPLSHTFDHFTVYRDELPRLLDEEAVRSLKEVVSPLVDWERNKSLPGSHSYDRVPHEVMSCVFFAKAWHDSVAADDLATPLEVTAAILGDSRLIAAVSDSQKRCWLPLIHDIVASAPADADRMDYLERDSKSIGVSYGLFDRNRVLKSLLCFRTTVDMESIFRLGVKSSGVPALENLVQARFELYVQIYFHKTNRATELMLGEMGRHAHAQGFRLFGTSATAGLQGLCDDYCELSDDRFLRMLRGCEPNVSPPPEVTRLADAVERRELWKRLYEGDDVVTQRVAEVLQNEQEDPAIAAGILSDVSKPKATKDLTGGAQILVRDESGIYVRRAGYDWADKSVIIRALHKAEGNIGRVYAKDAALPHVSNLKRRARAIGLAAGS
jgi:uncharacterized protein